MEEEKNLNQHLFLVGFFLLQPETQQNETTYQKKKVVTGKGDFLTPLSLTLSNKGKQLLFAFLLDTLSVKDCIAVKPSTFPCTLAQRTWHCLEE